MTPTKVADYYLSIAIRACPSICLSARLSWPNFIKISAPVDCTVARSSSDGVAICDVLPVL